MRRNYLIHSYRSAGNLHISLSGKFTDMCAWALFKTIRQKQKGAFRVFVNTSGLRIVNAKGAILFKHRMTRRPMPPDWLYFKGDAGFRIAPDGSRVLICKKDKKCKQPPVDHTKHLSGTVHIQSTPFQTITRTPTQATTQTATQATNRSRRRR